VKTQVVYVTNADYEATYQKLTESRVVIVDRTQKGLIWFRVIGTRTIFSLSPYGKLQVKWTNLEEKKILLKIVRNLLVAEEGQKMRIKPSGQQAFIPYPEPPSFKLYWCDEETEYVRKPVHKRTEESMIVTSLTIAITSIFSFIVLRGLSKEAIPIVSNQTGLEGFAMKMMVHVSPYLALVPIMVIGSAAILLKVKPSIADKLKSFSL